MQDAPTTESSTRVIVSRALCFLSVLLLYRTPDVICFGVLGLGLLTYYVPRAAAAPCPPPKSLRIAWMLAAATIGMVYLATDFEPPGDSIVPPILGYGLLLIFGIQVAWDFKRSELLREARPPQEEP